MTDTCIVITGLLKEEYMEHLERTYINIKNKILSTWEDQDKVLIEKLKSLNFIVVLNDYPSYKNQTNYQTKCIREGCLKAKELGFKYVGRMRTDLCCNNMPLFISSTRHLYIDKLCCPSGIWRPHTGYYIMEIPLFGEVEKLILWSHKEQEQTDTRFVEQYLLENYIGKSNLTLEDIKEHFNFCLTEARNNGITMFWRNHSIEIINRYCSGDFIRL
jgi:hypothetical protein